MVKNVALAIRFIHKAPGSAVVWLIPVTIATDQIGGDGTFIDEIIPSMQA